MSDTAIDHAHTEVILYHSNGVTPLFKGVFDNTSRKYEGYPSVLYYKGHYYSFRNASAEGCKYVRCRKEDVFNVTPISGTIRLPD